MVSAVARGLVPDSVILLGKIDKVCSLFCPTAVSRLSGGTFAWSVSLDIEEVQPDILGHESR